MKKLTAVFLLWLITVPLFAVEEGEVAYIGGTVAAFKEGTVGKFDTTRTDTLIFQHESTQLSIPYAKIESFEYQKEVAHHMGVIPTLAIVMVKYRQRRHYVRISYQDEQGVSQIAVFEVPKQMPKTIMSILQTRAPQVCESQRAAMMQQRNRGYVAGSNQRFSTCGRVD